ncbi:Sle1p [Marasmius tenuissimus]|nr:Sle1p [Marasmius tenuissimus]
MPFLYLTLFSFIVVAQALAPRGPACTQQYTVQSGDSCNAIEKNFKLTSGTVRSLNSLVNAQCTNLYPGQSLCLSTSSSGSSGSGGGGGTSCSQTYTVQSGDTCSKIEKNFGLSTGSVIKFNSAINPQCTNMYPGQSLCLVAGSSSGGSGGGGSTVTVTVTSAGPVQTSTVLATITQTYTLSASTETETKTLSPTTVTATIPVSVTATETSLLTTTATVTAPTVTETTTQSTTVTVTSTATPSASCPSVSRFACVGKDKSGAGDLYFEFSGFSAATQVQCSYVNSAGVQGACLYKKVDGTLINDQNRGNCPASMASVYASQ